jgi:hypothetical protein
MLLTSAYWPVPFTSVVQSLAVTVILLAIGRSGLLVDRVPVGVSGGTPA